ncbi:MAG: hypothetical protein HY664_03635 [Chloroflexi bacterium]|nr:hypothetical protein [Chloroflexota bacterium]
MKKLLVAVLIAAIFTIVFAVPAFAHVHGITPLSQCTVDSSNSGAIATDGTPADDVNGGPIIGLIPRDVGEAPLTVGDGGFGATAGHCP